MDKGVRKIREGIKRRKQVRLKSRGDAEKEYPPMISEEEKHGFAMPAYNMSSKLPVDNHPKQKNNIVTRQIALSLFLFIACAVLFKTSAIPLSGTKVFIEDALTEEFPFAKVHQWYVETLGVPLTLTPELPATSVDSASLSPMPIHGEVVETFATNGTGVMISPTVATNVHAWKQGVVIFAGNNPETDKTVHVQHPDGSKTTYGLLSTIDVHLYEFVGMNERIGTFEPMKNQDVAYFAIEKDKTFIDPAEVIRVDDVR